MYTYRNEYMYICDGVKTHTFIYIQHTYMCLHPITGNGRERGGRGRDDLAITFIITNLFLSSSLSFFPSLAFAFAFALAFALAFAYYHYH